MGSHLKRFLDVGVRLAYGNTHQVFLRQLGVSEMLTPLLYSGVRSGVGGREIAPQSAPTYFLLRAPVPHYHLYEIYVYQAPSRPANRNSFTASLYQTITITCT